MFAKHRTTEGINANQLTAKRHQIQIGLQNLVLAPSLLKHLSSNHLSDFLSDAALTAVTLEVLIEQTRELHGDGRGTTGFFIP